MKFEQTKLANGLHILAEIDPNAVSTAAGFFVQAGARDESPELAGVSHFLEHMAFKGTETRSADDINRLFDDIGAQYNAYTSEEQTVYHAAVLPEYLPSCIDLLADLIRPSLRRADFETERDVIMEEIRMYADSPLWSAYDRVIRNHFEDHPLGNCILGTSESIAQLSLEAMQQYHRERYSPSNIVLAVVGQVDFPALVRQVEAKCGQWENRPVRRELRSASAAQGPDELVHRPEFLQEAIYLMMDAPSSRSRLRFAADILATVIGDESGSRFYWSLVDTGRAESIEMSYHEYEEAGAFVVGAACEPESASENLAEIHRILEMTAKEGITVDELARAKSKLIARLVISGERPVNRIFPLTTSWIYRQEYQTLDEDVLGLEQVTMEDIAELLATHPLVRPSTVCLGPARSIEALRLGTMSISSRSPSVNRQ
ncbi:insulinase family protein [bacterium]|jgi:predicted Zn-dependent peptidase|nr:insulinase family protein [bacterium]